MKLLGVEHEQGRGFDTLGASCKLGARLGVAGL